MPDTFKNMMKNGWHPEKPGTTFKGQMNSLVGRKSDNDDRKDYVARPVSSLKDPSSFAPPPRRDPRDPLPTVSRTTTASSVGPGPPPTPARTATGASSVQSSPAYGSRQQAAAEETAPKKPWGINTTGLRTDHLPPPPGRRSAGGPPLPPPTSTVAPRASPTAGSPGPPSLPPRLPPRTGSGSSVPSATPSPPPPPRPSAASGYLNQSAVSRLSSAGVSVPGFGIGKSTSPAPSPSSDAPAPAPSPGSGSQMNELQNRFSKLGKSSLGSSFGGGGSTTTTAAANPPAEGTTWEQKQAALRTAQNFHKDPSSVSLADARASASTVNNFRQRHGEQVASGVRSANALNQKYGVADRLGSFAASTGHVGRQEEGVVGADGTTSAAPAPSPSPLASTASAAMGMLGKKKPPPPPPKKKPGLGGGPPTPSSAGDDAPPPIPTSTRPW